MTPADLRNARKSLGLTQRGLAKTLLLSDRNGDRSIRVWETDGNTVPGPVQVAVRFMLEQMADGKRVGKRVSANRVESGG